MIKLNTEHPIAYDSPDHIIPWGTMRDNSTNEGFIEEITNYFQSLEKVPFSFMDLGCSGGQLVVDIHNRGNVAVGLEGSDYSVKHQRANWPEHHNKILFTCDVAKPYSLEVMGEGKLLFNMITAWEVIEHIHPDELKMFFKNINDNLFDGGVFAGSISTKIEIIEGVKLHQSVFSETEWYNKFDEILEGTDLKLYKYPFDNVVRGDHGSFHIILRKEA